MRLRRTLRLLRQALASQKVRALLAAASISVGVSAFLVTSALSRGIRDGIAREVQAMGTNLLVVRPAQVQKLAARRAVQGVVTSLRVADQEALKTLPSVDRAAPGTERTLRLKAGSVSMEGEVLGTTVDFFSLRKLRLSRGRFFDGDEEVEASRVAVLGSRIAKTLFETSEPLGATLRVRGLPFEVVGVLEARGVLADGSDEDGDVFVPARTALRRLYNSTWLTSVFVSAAHPEAMAATESDVRSILRSRHNLPMGRPDDFAIQDQAKLLTSRETLASSLDVLAAALGGCSLLVSGAGVLTLMYLSVRDRTAEIGLRMAIGGRPRDIFGEFLMEAAAVTGLGWAGGAAIAMILAGGVKLATSWPVGFPSASLAQSLLVAMGTGLASGGFPAWRASRLTPSGALGAGIEP